MLKGKIEIIQFDNKIVNIEGKIAKECKEEDIALISKFKKYMETEGMSKARILKVLYIIRETTKHLKKPLARCGKEDIADFVRWLEQSDYADWTKHDFKALIKKFYKWLDGKDEYPQNVKWIKTAIKNHNKKIPEELLTRQEIKDMINSTVNIRDKAFMEALYFSGCRVSELMTRRIRHVQFGKPFTKIIVEGKTGMRVIQLTQDVYLRSWMNQHPCHDNIDAPLWANLENPRNNDVVSYSKMNNLLKVIGRKTGIKKRIYPHLFRHSRATELARYMTESQLKEFFGWTQASAMAAVYVHMSQKDLVDSLKKSEGKKVESKEEQKPTPDTILCIACGETNPKELKLCSRCGAIIDERYRIEISEKEKAMQTIVTALLDDKLVGNRLREIIETISKKEGESK